MIVVKHPQLPANTLLLEALHVVDCIAAAELNVDRFLPPLVLRSLISPNLSDVSDQLAYTDFTQQLLQVETTVLHKLLDSQMEGIRKMLDAARSTATAQLEELRQAAHNVARLAFDQEITRLSALRAVNLAIRPEEIDHLTATRDASLEAIASAVVRLDAVRVIVAA